MVRDAPAMYAGNGPRATDYARGARLNLRGQCCAMHGGAALIQMQSQTPAMRGLLHWFIAGIKKPAYSRLMK